jgi:hypothetical protein
VGASLRSRLASGRARPRTRASRPTGVRGWRGGAEVQGLLAVSDPAARTTGNSLPGGRGAPPARGRLASEGGAASGSRVGIETGGSRPRRRPRLRRVRAVFTSGGEARGRRRLCVRGSRNPVLILTRAVLGRRRAGSIQTDPRRSTRSSCSSASAGSSPRNHASGARLGAPYPADPHGGRVEEARELLDNDLQPSTDYSSRRPSAGSARCARPRVLDRALALPSRWAGPAGDAYLSGAERAGTLRSRHADAAWWASTGRSTTSSGRVPRIPAPVGGPGHARTCSPSRLGGWPAGPNAPVRLLRAWVAPRAARDVTGLSLFGGSPIFFSVQGIREGAAPAATPGPRPASTASRFASSPGARSVAALPRPRASARSSRMRATPGIRRGRLLEPRARRSVGGPRSARRSWQLYDFGLFTRDRRREPARRGVDPEMYVRASVSRSDAEPVIFDDVLPDDLPPAELTENARIVLAKRYLKKDERGPRWRSPR